VWQYLKKFDRYLSYLVLIVGLSIPLLLFLNRFLIPDVSFDSTNYHYYLGYKGFHPENNKYEFFPTGIHNFASFFDMFGYGLSVLVGYRLGTFVSVLSIYVTVFFLYKLVKLLNKKIEIIGSSLNSFLFVSSIISFELFLGIATYYVDALAMAFLVASTFYLFKYLLENKDKFLYISSLILSLAILGKQTNLYFVFPFGMAVLINLIARKTKFWLMVKKLFFTGVLLLSFPMPWYIKNFVMTGNPVFPFYNGIFKSEYFPAVNFEQVIFGGRNFVEKLLWGVYSYLEPVRLGEVHDLFTDYKINFYFVSVLLLLGLYLLFNRKKDLRLLSFTIFYLGLFEFWGLQFGYLRYGLILEALGGVLILLLINSFKNKWLKFIIIVPVFLFLIVQNKRIVNMSLAYDISFRPGYYYNRNTYFDKKDSLFDSKIETSKSNDYNPRVYLNCSVQGMTFYPLSEFNSLPVLNIDKRAYTAMTSNMEYRDEVRNRFSLYLDENHISGEELTFVAISTYEGLGAEYENCIRHIEGEGYSILGEEVVDFIDNTDIELRVVYGTLKRDFF